jgi:hypothetical protein
VAASGHGVAAATGPGAVVLQLRVVLAQISPLVWRRLLVTDQTAIAELHEVLQLAFGWSDEHLHRFVIHGVEYGQNRPGALRFSHDSRTTPLAQFGLRQGERFTYEYDFYDAWRHDLRVEAILAPAAGQRYPVCTGGARSAPPEDCGGAWAFQTLRQQHAQPLIALRMAELLRPLLAARDDQLVREVLGADRLDELAELRRWSRIDHFDRAAVNHALHTRLGRREVRA